MQAQLPNDARNYEDRGIVYRDKGDHERAIADYTKALSVDPGYYMAYVTRGLEYEETGELAKAQADFEATLKLPNVDQDIRELAQRHLARQ